MPLTDIDQWFADWDADSFVAFSQRGDEPAEADIAAVEAQIGFRFPEEFREYSLRPLGGLYLAVKEELWPRPRAYDVGPFWSFLYGLTVYSFCPQAPDWLRLRIAWQRMASEGYPGLVPFLRIIGDADLYCFTARQQIVRWRHETPDDPEETRETFSEVLMHEIHELEARKDRKMRGEDRSSDTSV